MIETLSQLTGWASQLLVAGFIVFLRVGGAMAVFPVFGAATVPARIRLFLTFAFSVIVAPAVLPTLPLPEDFRSNTVLFITEPLIGLGFGVTVRLMIIVLQVAGSIAAQATSLSQIMGGATADPQPAIGQILLVAGLALAVMLGLHIRLTEGFILSYDVFPPGQFPEARAFSDWGISRVAQTFAFAFSLAAPFVIVSLLYNIALGVINRAMPQLMVAFVGAPAITAGGLVLLLLTTPILLPIWQSALAALLNNPFGGW